MTVASPASLYSDLDVEWTLDAPLAQHTWYLVGGRADVLIRPRSLEALTTLVRRCHRDDIPLRVLGSGANLLIDDEGVDGVVVKLDAPFFQAVEWNVDGRVERLRAFGGASMEKLVQNCARRGVRGLEQMSGIPATVGGAIRMNAGGKFGSIGDAVDAVAILGMDGETRIFPRETINFGYRKTSLPAGIVLWASFRVAEDDPMKCRERVLEIFKYKKSTQPMGAASAGCMFRNPTMPDGNVESAGRLIDLAGMKGTRVGAALVSPRHGNFLAFEREYTNESGEKVNVPARSDDMRQLVEMVQDAVREKFGVELETEVVFWRRGERP
ncbi:MAG: UDP-N-acetylenolpyruvoylglucosamine reductase [Planctomycetota bacterium]|jgi:UDP-N-acetylmuramate dehydrogenase